MFRRPEIKWLFQNQTKLKKTNSTTSVKYVGVLLDEHLALSPQISHVQINPFLVQCHISVTPENVFRGYRNVILD